MSRRVWKPMGEEPSGQTFGTAVDGGLFVASLNSINICASLQVDRQAIRTLRSTILPTSGSTLRVYMRKYIIGTLQMRIE